MGKHISILTEGMDAFVSGEGRDEEGNGSGEMNNEEKIEKVNCKLCGEEIDDPFRTITADFNCINRSAFHFTYKHVKELREFLGKKTLADILGTDEDSLYPIYMEFYPDGDMLTASIEIEDLLYQFVALNVSANTTLEESE